MDFCPGGELFFHLHNLGRLTEEQARFYFAEILLGLEFLHKHNIIYRDLKPENVLLDLDGHIRLTDFGLSKDGITRQGICHSFCGSPEYMSPEMLRQQGHGRGVDHYSLGALLYEMLTGLPPFYDKNRSVMYRAIQSEPLKLPNFVSKNARSLLSGLLTKDPSLRLGSVGGFEEIKQHPWCSSIVWGRVLQKKKPPPFIPNLRLSNFDPEYTSTEIDFTELGRDPLPDSLQDPFEDFEYHKEADISEMGGEYKPIMAHSKSTADISNVSTSDTKSQTALSRNTSEIKIHTIVEEEEDPGSTKEIDLTLLKVFLPEQSPRVHMRELVYSDSESRGNTESADPLSRKSSQGSALFNVSGNSFGRRRPLPPIDPIPKDAIPARFESSDSHKVPNDRKRISLQPKSMPMSDLRIRGPDPVSVKVKPKPLVATYSQRELEEQKYEVSTKFWQDNFEEQSFVNQIPDFKPGVPESKKSKVRRPEKR